MEINEYKYESPYNDQNYKNDKDYPKHKITVYEKVNINIINNGKISKEQQQDELNDDKSRT